MYDSPSFAQWCFPERSAGPCSTRRSPTRRRAQSIGTGPSSAPLQTHASHSPERELPLGPAIGFRVGPSTFRQTSRAAAGVALQPPASAATLVTQFTGLNLLADQVMSVDAQRPPVVFSGTCGVLCVDHRLPVVGLRGKAAPCRLQRTDAHKAHSIANDPGNAAEPPGVRTEECPDKSSHDHSVPLRSSGDPILRMPATSIVNATRPATPPSPLWHSKSPQCRRRCGG